MFMVPGEAVKFPEHDCIKFATLGIVAKLRKTIPVKTPTRTSAIAIYGNHNSATIRDGKAATMFLCFKTKFILHFRRVARVNREPDTLVGFSFSRHDFVPFKP